MPVEPYYQFSDPPKENWALPERIAFSKHDGFSWQEEFRMAYPTNDAFRFENVKIQIADLEKHNTVQEASHGKRVFKIGNISEICKVHEF